MDLKCFCCCCAQRTEEVWSSLLSFLSLPFTGKQIQLINPVLMLSVLYSSLCCMSVHTVPHSRCLLQTFTVKTLLIFLLLECTFTTCHSSMLFFSALFLFFKMKFEEIFWRSVISRCLIFSLYCCALASCPTPHNAEEAALACASS